MKRMMYALFALLLVTAPAMGSSSDFSISLAHDSPREKQAEAQLKRLLDTYDLSPYSLTYSIRIAQGEIPHSHPVLTLNTRSIKDDTSALGTFLHEQFHWFAVANEKAVNDAIKDLKALYPNVPVGGPNGARDTYSTYLHLLVCLWEHRVLARYVGEDEATRAVEGKRHYVWIYRQVLENGDALMAILDKHGLSDPSFQG